MQLPSIICRCLVGGIIIRYYMLGATAWDVVSHGRVGRIIEKHNGRKRWIVGHPQDVACFPFGLEQHADNTD